MPRELNRFAKLSHPPCFEVYRAQREFPLVRTNEGEARPSGPLRLEIDRRLSTLMRGSDVERLIASYRSRRKKLSFAHDFFGAGIFLSDRERPTESDSSLCCLHVTFKKSR
jgi:hypothetical protein